MTYTEETMHFEPGSSKTYFWVVTTYEGRPVILGPCDTEDDANRLGFEKLQGNFTVEELFTRDKGRATAAIKKKILDRTGSLEQALRRARHNV